jgi:hypothetical protein
LISIAKKGPANLAGTEKAAGRPAAFFVVDCLASTYDELFLLCLIILQAAIDPKTPGNKNPNVITKPNGTMFRDESKPPPKGPPAPNMPRNAARADKPNKTI